MPSKSKKSAITFSKVSKADIAMAKKRLRYMNIENVAKDFKSKKERAAIAAMLRWFDLNGIVAWEMKRPGHYTLSASRKRGFWTPHQAVVVPVKSYNAATKLLGKPSSAWS
jgi:hypothetical protein